MNSVFPKVIDEIKRQDSINALHKAVPDHNCKNSECEAECGKVVKIARNLGVDPVPMVQDAIEKTLASKFGCKRKTEAFSNIGYPIPGCKFGYTYGSHPDATDAQLGAKGKSGISSKLVQNIPAQEGKSAKVLTIARKEDMGTKVNGIAKKEDMGTKVNGIAKKEDMGTKVNGIAKKEDMGTKVNGIARKEDMGTKVNLGATTKNEDATESSTITDTQIPDASEGVQVAGEKPAGAVSDSQNNETAQDKNKTAPPASSIQNRVEEAKEKIRQVVDEALKSAKDGVIPPEKLENVENVIKEEKTKLENLLKAGGKILEDNKKDAEGLLEDGKAVIGDIEQKSTSKYRDKMKEKGPGADAADSVSAGIEAAKQAYDEISNALKQMHYERNKRQGNLPKSPTEAVEQGYAEASRSENKYHGGDKGNKKYVNKETGQEVVFDKDGNTVTSPEEGGTYNYGKAPFSPSHVVRDMLPYWIWGNSPEDSTKTKDRILGK